MPDETIGTELASASGAIKLRSANGTNAGAFITGSPSE
jgi:hypothetical protein